MRIGKIYVAWLLSAFFLMLGSMGAIAQTYERTFSFKFVKENMTVTENENGCFVKPDRLVHLWSYNDDEHKPALPYIRYEILLPDNFQVKSFSFLSKEEEEYPRAITLGTNSLPMPTEEGTDNEEGSSLYPLITYPAEVLLFEESIMDGYRIAFFLINPFTYYAESRKLWLTTNMNLRIIVEPVDKDEEVGHVGTMKDIVKNSVYNPEDMDAGTENWTIYNEEQSSTTQKTTEFSITGTKWYSNFHYENFIFGNSKYSNTTICYSIGEDTICNGEIWKSFYQNDVYQGAIREKNGQVWFFPNEENIYGLRKDVPTLLHDFSLQVGDVIYESDYYPGFIKEISLDCIGPEWDEFDEDFFYPITVKEVREVHGRKVISFDSGLQWIEGIGRISSPFFSAWMPWATDGSSGGIKLYQVVSNGQNIYFNGEFANPELTPWMKEGMIWTQNWGYSDTSDGQFRQIMLKEEVRPGTFTFDWTESMYSIPYDKLQEFNGKVYAYDEYYHRFDLCYDFTLQEGDEVKLLASYDIEDPTRFSFPILRYDTCFVSKVDSVEIDGMKRKRLTLTGDRDDVWVEGIGSLNRVFPIDGFDISQSVVYNPSRITCLSNNEESLYLHPDFIDCTTPRVDNIPFLSKEYTRIQINGSTLLCTSSTAVKLEVYTMEAIKVGEANFASGKASVKVKKTPATYLYIVTYPDEWRESGKVMMK